MRRIAPSFTQRHSSKSKLPEEDMLRRFIAFAIVACAFFTAPAFGQGKEKVVLLLNWYTYSEHAPLYLGKERGYFDQEGIDLDIQEGRGSGTTVQAVAAGTPTLRCARISAQI